MWGDDSEKQVVVVVVVVVVLLSVQSWKGCGGGGDVFRALRGTRRLTCWWPIESYTGRYHQQRDDVFGGSAEGDHSCD